MDYKKLCGTPLGEGGTYTSEEKELDQNCIVASRKLQELQKSMLRSRKYFGKAREEVRNLHYELGILEKVLGRNDDNIGEIHSHSNTS